MRQKPKSLNGERTSMTIRGRGAVVRAAGAPFEVVEIELDEPGAGEVLVRLVATGLCHTDLGVQAIGAPFALPGILGHEGAGVVERVGVGVTAVAPGDKVLMSFTSCGACEPCAAGHPAYCDTWFPRNVLGELRGTDSAATRIDGEPTHAHFFGQSAFAEYSIDRVPERLELARRLGATDVVDASREDVPARIAELTGGRGTSLAFDTTASPAVGAQALASTAVGGTVLIVGVAPPGTELPVEMTGLLQGKSLRGITMGDADPGALIPELVALHGAGELPLELLTRTYPLADIDRAAHDMHGGVTVKPVITF